MVLASKTLGQTDISRPLIHPSTTIIAKPWYANYVRHVTECESCESLLIIPFSDAHTHLWQVVILAAAKQPCIIQHALIALSRYTQLQTFSWAGEVLRSSPELRQEVFGKFLSVLQNLQVQQISIDIPASL